MSLCYPAVNVQDSRSHPIPAVNNMSRDGPSVVQQPRENETLETPEPTSPIPTQNWAHSRPQHTSGVPDVKSHPKHQTSSPPEPGILQPPSLSSYQVVSSSIPSVSPPLQLLFSRISLALAVPVSSPGAISSTREPFPSVGTTSSLVGAEIRRSGRSRQPLTLKERQNPTP